MRFQCLILLLISIHAGVIAQPCKCKIIVPLKYQPRGVEKNTIESNSSKNKKEIIPVEYMYQWQDRYKEITGSISINSFSKASRRRPGTPEDTIYTVKGYLWYVKKIGFDCDFHMELGPEDSTAVRMVIEVTIQNESLQKKIKAHLDSLNLPVMGCTTKNEKKAHFTKGIPVIVTGYGFFDALHKPGTNHGDRHTNKYSWELHPVISINFLN